MPVELVTRAIRAVWDAGVLWGAVVVAAKSLEARGAGRWWTLMHCFAVSVMIVCVISGFLTTSSAIEWLPPMPVWSSGK